jgi:homoserine dehydrogenase
LRLALLGFGGVGQALARQIAEHEDLIVTSITDTGGTLTDASGLDLPRTLRIKEESGTVAAGDGGKPNLSAREAAVSSPADVVVQLTPSDMDAPRENVAQIEAALSAGRDVVTAAKDALACRPVKVRACLEGGGSLRYGATVGASTPVLQMVDGGSVDGTPERISAVLNGSTTAILAAIEQGRSLGEALDEARDRGLLEADPSADLLGTDAAAKAAIIHQEAYGSDLRVDDVRRTGITGIDTQACREAYRKGFSVRLLAKIDEEGAVVGPGQLPREDPIVTDGPEAAVKVRRPEAGQITLSGPGAGPRETASAVLADVLAARDGSRSNPAPASGKEGENVTVRE